MYYPERLTKSTETELEADQDLFFDIISSHYDTYDTPIIDSRLEDDPRVITLLTHLHHLLQPRQQKSVDSWAASYQAFHFATCSAQLAGMHTEKLNIVQYFDGMTALGIDGMAQTIRKDVATYYDNNPETLELITSYLDEIAGDKQHYQTAYEFAGLAFILLECSQPDTQINILRRDIDAFGQGESL